MNDLSSTLLEDLFYQNPQVVDAGGFSVIPAQAGLCHNQPLYLHTDDEGQQQWCTIAGIGARGLVIRFLDGSYAHNVDLLMVSNVGIQA
jgi:hypothetical protein